MSESITIDPGTGTPAIYTTAHTFNTANQVTTCTYPDGSVLTKTYTDRNQLQSLSGGGGVSPAQASFVYDSGMRESSRTTGNNIVTNKTPIKFTN